MTQQIDIEKIKAALNAIEELEQIAPFNAAGRY